MKYTLMLNAELDSEGRNLAWLRGYKPEDKMVEAYKGTIEPLNKQEDGWLEAAAEVVWEMFNIAHPADYRGRSMCIGDVVIFEVSDTEKVSFAADTFGFKQLE